MRTIASESRALSVTCSLLLLAASAWAGGKEDWDAALSGTGERSAAGTGVMGMTSEELDTYSDAEEESGQDEETPQDFIRSRRIFVMREMKFNADWDTDPTALPAMVDQLKRRTGMKALALQPRAPLSFESKELTDWPFIYMTAHNAFTLSEEQAKGLRRYLLNGGFLYIDDCLYGFPFGQAVPGEMLRALPETELKPLDPKYPVFSIVLRQKYAWNDTNEVGLPRVLKPNEWKFIEIGGHMAVLYTPQDIGCAWEISSPPSPANPLGGAMHNLDRMPGLRECCYRLGVNIILYSMLH